MTAPLARSRRTRALPLGVALVSALAFLPNVSATAAGTPNGATAPLGQAAAGSGTAAEGPELSYVVNVHPGRGASRSVQQAITDAGGTVLASYDQIGVLVVHSANPDFAQQIRTVRGVDSAGATRTAPLPAQSTGTGAPQPLTGKLLEAAQGTVHGLTSRGDAAAAADSDPLEPQQWDMRAIEADKAHEQTLGSPDVTVAVIDTGVDDTHPDLAPNFNRDASVNCVTGKPDTADGAWRPTAQESPHGTHVAGEIAAAKNGVGMVGVAPGVKVAGIKVATTAGFFYTEAVVCGFVWAAEHHVDVTNNSYFTDPWYFNCTDDPDQGALVEAVTRASRYAERKGTVNVASAGNEEFDLSTDQITDPQSPNDSTPGDRVIDPTVCKDIPTMLPGVVTVSATGAKSLKASYSNYGHGIIDIAAPGGDSTSFQPPEAPATNGSILGTLPGGAWGFLSGTSMASPHVVGVAALIKSTHPDATPAEVKALLYKGADATACTNPYDINRDGQIDAVCEGGTKDNGFYGAGIANALNAVQK